MVRTKFELTVTDLGRLARNAISAFGLEPHVQLELKGLNFSYTLLFNYKYSLSHALVKLVSSYLGGLLV